jgi:hypothetical protein
MSDDKPYRNGFQRRAVEALLRENLTVELDMGEIHAYGSKHNGVTALSPELGPYEIGYIRGVEGDAFAFKAVLRADWSEVDFDDEPYQEDTDE